MIYLRRTITILIAAWLSLASNPLQATETTKYQNPKSDEEEIRRLVTDSQFEETLGYYVNPSAFDKTSLTRFFVSEDKGGKAVVQVENSIRRLLDKHWHYAKESANEQFEIRSITIFAPGDVADVRTRERWYVPMVDEQDRLVKD